MFSLVTEHSIAEDSPDHLDKIFHDGEWVGTCLLFPSPFHFDTDPREAIAGIMDLVDGCLHDMTENVGAHP